MNRLNEKSQIINAKQKQAIPQECFAMKDSIITQLPDRYSRPHKKIEFHNFTLTITKSNNYCYLKDKTVVVIKHI